MVGRERGHERVDPPATAWSAPLPDVVLMVRAADCVPVLLADPGAGVIGAAHAGRGGLVAGVVPAVVRRMRELGAARVHGLVGALRLRRLLRGARADAGRGHRGRRPRPGPPPRGAPLRSTSVPVSEPSSSARGCVLSDASRLHPRVARPVLLPARRRRARADRRTGPAAGGGAVTRHEEIAEGLARVRRTDRDGRPRRRPRPATRSRLVVVTKYFPASDVRILADLGVRDVGENRHQEAEAKAEELAELELRLALHRQPAEQQGGRRRRATPPSSSPSTGPSFSAAWAAERREARPRVG